MIYRLCGTQLAKRRIRLGEAGMVEARTIEMQILLTIMQFSPLPQFAAPAISLARHMIEMVANVPCVLPGGIP